jgi:hypothetical protein
MSFGTAIYNMLLGDRSTSTAIVPERAITQSEPARQIELGEQLMADIGRLGSIQESMGGFRIKTSMPLAFPFGRILTTLTSRNFRVTVSQQGSTLVIEARP